jgi:DNA-binding NtrC family response regulator
MSLPRILIIDDLYGHDEVAREAFCDFAGLKNMNGKSINKGSYFAEAYFCSGQIRNKQLVRNDLDGVLKTVESGWPFKDGGRWALVLIDYEFPTGRLSADGELAEGQLGDREFGKTILEEIVGRWPFESLFSSERDSGSSIPCIMFTSRNAADVEPKVDPLGNRGLIQRSANWAKPINWTKEERINLRRQLADLLFLHGLVADGTLYKVGQDGEPVKIKRTEPMIGKSLTHLRALRNARAAAEERGFSFTLVQGEKGTGKENFARYIHECSRQGKEFISLDLKAVPEGMIGSEISGYRGGAFTGALRDGAIGIFEQAGEGTVFFDEIGNLELASLQILLNPTGSAEIKQLGPNAKRKSIKCQVVCATNKPIAEMVEEGEFPDDLFDRFDEASLYVPPLHAREGDKRLLFDYFRDREVKKLKCRPKIAAKEVYDWIEQYSWPGNVRELEKVVERVVKARTHSGTIQVADLERALQKSIKHFSESRCADFNDLLHEIRSFKFPNSDKESVRGAVPLFKQAAGELITHMFEMTQKLDGVIMPSGKFNCTGSVRAVLGESMLYSSVLAQRDFNDILGTFDLDKKNQIIEKLITWAQAQKREKKGNP